MTRDGSWNVHIARIGVERAPVAVIDGFAPDPSLFVDDAAMLAFVPMGVHYPGIRAPVPDAIVQRLARSILPLAREQFGAGALDVTDAFYSLVTTPPGDLAPIQRLPHFDGVEDTRLALLLYLSPDAPGGTAFYRHRTTGFESITADRLDHYRDALDADLASSGMPAPAFIDGDTEIFVQTARFPGLCNRALLYRGNLLHCAWLPPETPLLADPCRGRLTMNLFLDIRQDR